MKNGEGVLVYFALKFTKLRLFSSDEFFIHLHDLVLCLHKILNSKNTYMKIAKKGMHLGIFKKCKPDTVASGLQIINLMRNWEVEIRFIICKYDATPSSLQKLNNLQTRWPMSVCHPIRNLVNQI